MTPAEALQSRPPAVGAVDAEWLLAHVLNCRRPEIFLHRENLTAAQAAQWRELAGKRASHIPLQHLLGTVEFCGLEITVNPDVLIPRPETEILAEAAWQFAAKFLAPSVLDYGTGGGCLAIAIAKNCPKAAVTAIDISSSALNTARANAKKNKVTEQLSFFESDSFAALPSEKRFHLIVANPPYIPTAEIETLQPEVRDHDPHQALDGGPDGLGAFRVLAAGVRERLLAGGKLMMEAGDGQTSAVAKLFEAIGEIEILPDLNNVQRIVVATAPNP